MISRRDTLGFSDEQLNDFGFNMLEALGFSKEEIEAANIHVCGAMTLEGAPHLKMSICLSLIARMYVDVSASVSCLLTAISP